jgi:hypothetical protein
MQSFVRSALEAGELGDVDVVRHRAGSRRSGSCRGPYDLDHTDINMPDINRLELISSSARASTTAPRRS